MADVRHLTQQQLAERLGVSERTVEGWRKHGRGPAYIKGGGTKGFVRYRLADVEAWEESLIVRPAVRHLGTG